MLLLKKIIMKKLSLTLLVLNALVFHSVFALDVNKKFGKVSLDELNVSVCPIDSNAHAFYIFDKGQTYFTYIEGFNYYYERHFRIKILDNQALDEASFEIPLYTYNTSSENIGKIKAVTYNLEGGKKVVSQKMDKNAIFREASSKYYTNVKFTLPNVKAGSVIEVSYSIISKRDWDIPGWTFQHYIPTLSSEYFIKIPEYYFFNQTTLGYYKIDVERDESMGVITFRDGGTLNYRENVFNYSVSDVLAFPVGEYLTTPNNYLSRVGFELSRYEIPGVVYKNFNTSWDDVNKLLLEADDFGQPLKTTGFLKDHLETLVSNSSSETDRMLNIFDFVKTKTTWNESNSNGTSKSLKKTLEDGEGNCADINLLLVAMLREAGLDAYPVALSTRKNGMIHPSHASISQLNYVIALCKIGDASYTMDATDDFSPVNILPVRCLNDKGRIVSKDCSAWHSLLSNNKSVSETNYNLNLNENGNFEGHIKIEDKKYSALRKRNTISNYESTQKYVDKIMESNPGLEIGTFNISNYKEIDKDLIADYQVNITKQAESVGDLLFFTPLLYDKYGKNPFSMATREYPIEYPYPIDEKVKVEVALPEGYTIESVPESVKYTALDGNLIYSFHTTVGEKSIEVNSILEINRTIFLPAEYQTIQELFEQMVKKQNERIVLKKI